MLAETVAASVLWSVVFVVAEEFFGMAVRIGAGLAVVEVRRWDPFGISALVFAGSPALLGDFVLGAAGQR
jgi:hypothetical protein